MTVVYVAGPMRGRPAFGFRDHLEAADELRRSGVGVVSPAELDMADGFVPWGYTGHEDLDGIGFDLEAAVRRDVAAIVGRCDGIALLPGWQKSTGSCLEAAIANAAGLDTYEYQHPGRLVPTNISTEVRAAKEVPA